MWVRCGYVCACTCGSRVNLINKKSLGKLGKGRNKRVFVLMLFLAWRVKKTTPGGTRPDWSRLALIGSDLQGCTDAWRG